MMTSWKTGQPMIFRKRSESEFQWLETTELHPFLNPRPLERSEKIISAGNNDHRECFNPNSTRFKIQKQLHVTRLEILTFPVSVFA